MEVCESLRAGCLLGTESFIEAIRPALLEQPLDQNVLRRQSPGSDAVMHVKSPSSSSF